MRKLNSISDFTSERNAFLLSRVKAAFASMEVINMRHACELAVADPAPRFWVNECRAAIILRRMMRDQELAGSMIPEKRAMYILLLSRVREMARRRPGSLSRRSSRTWSTARLHAPSCRERGSGRSFMPNARASARKGGPHDGRRHDRGK